MESRSASARRRRAAAARKNGRTPPLREAVSRPELPALPAPPRRTLQPAATPAATAQAAPVGPQAWEAPPFEEVPDEVENDGAFWGQGTRNGAASSSSGSWLFMARSMPGRIQETLNEKMPFAWSERVTRRTYDRARRARALAAVAVLLVLVGVASLFAFTLARRAIFAAEQRVPTPAPATNVGQGVLIQPGGGSLTPTPAAPQYLMGAWVSNTTPSGGGFVTVYVRVTQGDRPAANVPVTISVRAPAGQGFPGVSTGYGPTATNAYGIAAFNVSFDARARGKPYFVDAAASPGGQSLSASTTFVPY